MSLVDSCDANKRAPYMPETIQEIGSGLGRHARRFAVIAPEGCLPWALAALADVTNRCVACHTHYWLL